MTPSLPPASCLEVRSQLGETLVLDLVGPWPGHDLADERLPAWERPSNWYLTGFLIPSDSPPQDSADMDEDDDLDETPDGGGLTEETTEERKAAKKGYFPSSMGLSFLVPEQAGALSVTVSWGDYAPATVTGPDGKPQQVWQRTQRQVVVPLPLGGPPEAQTPRVHSVPGSEGLLLYLLERAVPAMNGAASVPPGSRSVSLFLVNQRAARPREVQEPDVAYAFQATLEVRSESALVPWPNLRAAHTEEWDEQVADLHYRDTPEYAAGHGISTDWEVVDGACHVLRSVWIPSAEVESTITAKVPDVELSMDVLGALPDGGAAAAALQPLVTHYRAWNEGQAHAGSGLSPARRDTAAELLQRAAFAGDRIARGIALLRADSDALDAFRVANRAVSRALKQRLAIDKPRWRPFQLAFLLLNLPGVADPGAPERTIVDLLFFPTGGGKTEAYLGLSAFTMVLRRLHHRGAGGHAGAGVSVIMRYTLRLLTLDQLVRAAGLVCALELERADAGSRYGDWPFEIGLWVGKAVTPNILGRKSDNRSDSARARVRRFKADPTGNPSPIPLENCPWCATKFAPDSFDLQPDADQPRELCIVCTNFECDFTRQRALPILAVDETIYRRLPAFLIATVDKFASLPWFGATGALLGAADRYDEGGFYGAAAPNRGRLLPAPLLPPDLIIQDELHLISGPLGTMAGLYETALEGLCLRLTSDAVRRPKIVASTATVRRAGDQIQALFARPLTQVFPPPGPDRADSFFARTVPAAQVPARRYAGVAAQGRNPKVIMRKVWLALMGATAWPACHTYPST